MLCVRLCCSQMWPWCSPCDMHLLWRCLCICLHSLVVMPVGMLTARVWGWGQSSCSCIFGFCACWTSHSLVVITCAQQGTELLPRVLAFGSVALLAGLSCHYWWCLHTPLAGKLLVMPSITVSHRQQLLGLCSHLSDTRDWIHSFALVRQALQSANCLPDLPSHGVFILHSHSSSIFWPLPF